MQRARLLGTIVLTLVLSLTASWGPPTLAADVAWPTSTLVISEVQTGGASASDEFVEVANQGQAAVELMGLEVVYATSSGSTVTRKGSWAESLVLQPGRRILLVNGAGAWSAAGDVTYTGGFAAAGGAVALRVVGGAVIDAVGWGDATSSFVEGAAAPAPAAGSSIERRPGGGAGNGTDTNDNANDWVVNPAPGPQGLAAAPVPVGPTPTPTATATPTASPTAVPTASPTAVATPSPTAVPTSTPTAEPSATPTPSPTPLPTATATPTPTPSPTPSPTPTPTPTPNLVTDIDIARGLSDGAVVTIAGTLTTTLGALEDGRTAFVEDHTAGIALYLDAPAAVPHPIGTSLTITGELDTRYGQRTLRVAEDDLVIVGPAVLPPAPLVETGAATEAFEGRRLAVDGVVVGSTSTLSDGLAVSIDDGSGSLRLIVTPAALASRTFSSGLVVHATGPLGQRDSSGTGVEGYRLFVTEAADLAITPATTASPSATPAPTPTPSPSPTASPTLTPAPTSSPSIAPTPTPSPATATIGAARGRAIGTSVTVRGVVTGEPGRIGTPPLFVIADPTGGIVVRLPAGLQAPARGTALRVHGALADPYGQLEIRPAIDGITVEGPGTIPAAVTLATAPNEGDEGRLVTFEATVDTKATKSTSGDLSFLASLDGGGQVRVMADVSSGIAAASIVVGAEGRVAGIVGQRASKKGEPDGYRVWVRDPRDLALVAPRSPSSTPRPSSGPTATTTPRPSSTASTTATIAIAAALARDGRDVTVSGVVTAGGDLLDATGRRIVIQDSSAAVEVLVPSGTGTPRVGDRVRVRGKMGVAYGSPRLRGATVEALGRGSLPAALVVRGQFSAAHQWRLVRIDGRIEDVSKLGERWRAEIAVGTARLVVVGQPGASIPVGSIIEGRQISATGIVRAAYPTATDRRATLLPRSAADIIVRGSGSAAGAGSTGGGPGETTQGGGTGASVIPGRGDGASDGGAGGRLVVPDADLADLAASVGLTVRVGGLVVALTADGFTLDDGTAIGRIVLAGEAAPLRELIEPGDAINVVGRVTPADGDGGTFVVTVEDPDTVVLGSIDRAGPEASGSAPPLPLDGSTDGTGSTRDAGLAAGFDPGAGGAGVLSLIGIVLLSIAITWLRRRHARRLLDSRVAVRLAAIGGASRDAGTTP